MTPQVSPDGKSLAYRSPGSSAELSLRPRSRIRPRSAGLWQRRQGSAGSLGDPRALSAVRVDAGRQVDRDLGRGQDLARRRRQREGSADSVPGARRADAQRRRAHPTRAVHPAEFPVRMLRDVRVSPDGKLVVYSALGHLYSRALPSGEPKRLTAAAADGKDDLRVLPVVLARRPVDRLHDVERRRRSGASAS